MTTHTPASSLTLDEIARARRPRVKAASGIRGGGAAKHVECYVCDRQVNGSSFAAKYGQTKRSLQAVAEHLAAHQADLDAGRLVVS